jgi:hypothetical protein
MIDANTVILLPLAGAHPTWRHLVLVSCRSKMTLVVRKRLAGRQLTRDSLTQIVAVQLSSLGGGDWK